MAGEYDLGGGLSEQIDGLGASGPLGSPGLDQAGRGDVLLTGGGIIPPDDVAALERQGVGRLFGPGTPTSDLVKYIEAWAADHVSA